MLPRALLGGRQRCDAGLWLCPEQKRTTLFSKTVFHYLPGRAHSPFDLIGLLMTRQARASLFLSLSLYLTLVHPLKTPVPSPRWG